MSRSALFLAGAIGLAASALPAGAAPIAPSQIAAPASGVVQVAGRCSWDFHPNRLGHCVRNRYAYYRPRPYWQPRPYWPGYSGDGYEPWNRPSPTDHVANQLNRQVLMYGY